MNKKIAVVNVKNLAVFVIMAVITMFMAVGITSAHQQFPLPIWGVYGATIECTCILAPFGFNPNLTPINNVGLVSIQNRKATFTFEKHGTGSVTGNGSQISLSPPASGSFTYSNDFTYTVTHDRIITLTPGTVSVTFTAGPNNGVTYHSESQSSHKGTITPDGKIITIFADASDLGTLIGPNLPPTNSNQSCTCISVLTWQGNEK